MQVQKIFLITPLGNKYSDARKHADRMWNEVFVSVSEKISTKDLKVEFERSDLMDEGSNSRVKKIMELIRESSGCIVDLYTIGNLNVMYEVGLAHSQGKRVFFLRSDKIEENEIPSDIRYYAEYYYTYNLDVFRGNASSDEVGNIQKEIMDVAIAMVSSNTKYTLYRPCFYEPTNLYVENLLEGINRRITNIESLVKDFGSSSEDKRTLAQYIIGENDAFDALTEAVKKSNISVKTTRFSPYSVVGRQNVFFSAINNLMTNEVTPDKVERIITANNNEKFDEIAKLMVNNAGKDFDIYISRIEYSFEMVVIDDEIVFIHFRKYNQQEKEKRNASPTLISATLRIEKRIIANEFSTIFDSIKSSKKDMLAVIRCKDITTENLSEKIRKYKRLFEEAVKEYQMSQGVLEDSNIPLSKNDKE